MGCGDIDTRKGTGLAHGKGKLGRGAKVVKDIYLYTRAGKNARGCDRELAGVVTGVIGNRNTALLAALALYERCKSACGVHYRVDIHTADAKIHRRAKARGTEIHGCREAKLLCLLVITDREKLVFFLVGEDG